MTASAPKIAPPDTIEPGFARFVLLVVQLGLLLWVANIFLIEQTYGFNKLIPIIFVGFIIHVWLAPRLRAPFFLLLFPISAVSLLGPVPGTALMVLGIMLFLLCHLPLSISARAGILIVVGIALAGIRAGLFALPIPGVQMYFQTQTLPILSAMFMFRTAVYLYDLRHEKGPVTWWQRLGYFFLFPNVCFPLFPVIDYQTYKRTYFNQGATEIYQRGIEWILRGITHLLLYRIVYQYFLPDPLSIDTFAGVGQYALSSFLLYLRVSGLFHLIVGILCLFGFNLPETHHRYYLSESFTDFWRRINIYWKDFMMKLFYYPIFLRLKHWGTTRAMIAATLITFVITWALHSYQWFWLRGSFPFHPQDILFWSILAILVTFNSLYEEKYGRKRKSLKKKTTLSIQDAVVRSAKVVAVFVAITLLWSFWTSRSIDQWLSVMSVAARASALEWLSFAALCGLAIAIGVAVQLYGDRRNGAVTARTSSIPHRAAWVGGTAVLLIAFANPTVSNRLDPRAEHLIATITGDQLNKRDDQQMVNGYYEELLGGESSGSMAWSVRLEKPENWEWNGAPESEYRKDTDDIRVAELKPSVNAIHKGAEFVTNRWGLRGPEIDTVKPAGTYRIAMLGSSYTQGAGVDYKQTFPSLLEQQLNSKFKSSDGRQFTLLNFSYGGDSILRRLVRFQKQALDFDVDMVIDMSTTDERFLAIRTLRIAFRKDVSEIDPFLRDVITRAKITREMSNDEIEKQLMPFAEEVCEWGYQQLAITARENNIRALIFMLPRTPDTDVLYDAEWQILSAMLDDTKMRAISLKGVYGPLNDRNNLKLAPWDWHPNSKGHELIANRLYEELTNLEFGIFTSAVVSQ